MTVNSNDPHVWREKYLNALDEQEQLEKTFTEQLAILRSALVRVSIAADGQDATLDTILASLREKLRGNISATEIAEITVQLEREVLNFEARCEHEAQEVRQALMGIAKPLQHFKLSPEVKKDLGDYLSLLPQRSKKIHLYAELLTELADIQQRALSDIEQPKPGLLDRLLGVKAEPGAAELPVDMSDLDAAEQEVLGVELEQQRAEARDSLQIKPRAKSQVADLPPEYASAITRVLSQFLASLENEKVIKDKVDAIRFKVEQGLVQTALIPTLEAVRDLVMEAYLAANQAFANYLN